MRGTGTIFALKGILFNGLDGGSFDTLDRTLNCYGSSSVQTSLAYFGNLYFGLNAAINIMPGAIFNGSRLLISGSSTSGQTLGIVRNQGTLVIDVPGHGMSVIGTAFVNDGEIRVTNSQLDVRGTPGQPGFVQTSGSTQLINGTLWGDENTINGGSLSGYGTIGGIVSNGRIAPSGILNCFGTVKLLADSVLAYDLKGTEAGVSYGQIANSSKLTLAGSLEVTLSPSFLSQITPSDRFILLSAQSFVGQFTNVVSGARLPTTDGNGSFIVTYSGNQVVLSSFVRTEVRPKGMSFSRQGVGNLR
ncbi:MAG TPA: hypothetical protein VK581_08385 [Chthoniobacterales bacterium]|nr:hypothetical protein [Chthoniobacterales bacterium]